MNRNHRESSKIDAWSEPAHRAIIEAQTRPERLNTLSQLVDELFPMAEQEPLRNKIKRSFAVPQFGEYHNEGLFMDCHLLEILYALEDVERGDLPQSIPESDRRCMQEIAIRYHDELQKYVFLHDISKADLLHIEWHPSEGAAKGVAWEGTLEEWYQEHHVTVSEQSDPLALLKRLSASGVKGISYYHKGIEVPEAKRKTTTMSHGAKGVSEINAIGGASIPSSICTAIEKHEIAYLFNSGKAVDYARHFEALSTDERGLVLVASCIDTMASWRKNGEPNLENFLSILSTKSNDDLIRSVEGRAELEDPNNKLDKTKVRAIFMALRKTESRITESAEELILRILRDGKRTEYHMETVRAQLNALVEKQEIQQTDVDELADLIQTGDMASIDKKFGKKMKVIIAILRASQKMG